MNGFGDNPFDDGLDFVGCPPQKAELKLPKFPKDLKSEGKLIRWARNLSFADGERMLNIVIEDFGPDPSACGVYNAIVHFFDAETGDIWYKGRLKFYYTRNYFFRRRHPSGKEFNNIAFRFVVKGDIERVSDNIPEWVFLILCTKKNDEVRPYEKIFVYGGLDLIYDLDAMSRTPSFMLNLGHNDGWFTHHPECSKRPIVWSGYGDYIGHYCERGWLFVSPGKNFVFEPSFKPPTGRFLEEAFREVGKPCFTEEAIRWGALDLKHIQFIHSFQELEAVTECKNGARSAEFCPGLVYSGKKVPWLVFFSMGYWQGLTGREDRIVLHQAEGNVALAGERFVEQFGKELYFYGFGTQHYLSGHKLVDMASNQNTMGVPDITRLLMYLYNAGNIKILDPGERPSKVVSTEHGTLVKMELKNVKTMDKACPFLRPPKS